jgi:hypothetical protein
MSKIIIYWNVKPILRYRKNHEFTDNENCKKIRVNYAETSKAIERNIKIYLHNGIIKKKQDLKLK